MSSWTPDQSSLQGLVNIFQQSLSSNNQVQAEATRVCIKISNGHISNAYMKSKKQIYKQQT